jgi:cytochrome c oxidase subunit 3
VTAVGAMASASADLPLRRRPIAPNAVVGMLIFVVAEVMFFAALMSALLIVQSNAAGVWPPPDQPRLPIALTAVNTGFLLASGVATYMAHRAFAFDPRRVVVPLGIAIVLGAVFVIVQGSEWAGLIAQGLTLTSSTHGGFFYLIVGAHALHAIAAIGFLCGAYSRAVRGTLEASTLWAAEILWYFVVGVWPVLYVMVYL